MICGDSSTDTVSRALSPYGICCLPFWAGGSELNAHMHLPLCMLVGEVAQGRQGLAAGSNPPRPQAVRADSGAPRSEHLARYLWAQLLARIFGVVALK